MNLASNQLCGVDYAGRGTYTTEGIIAIADALKVTASLTELNMYNNYLKDEGVTAICEALQSNKETKLASLNVGDNRISPVGAKAVAAMAAVVASLTEVR